MCTRTRTNSSRLMSAYAGFLDRTGMGDPAAVSFHPSEQRISLQPHVNAWNDPVAVVSALLLWSRTLTGVRVEWTRTDADTLHITITGRLASGVIVRVYSSIAYHHAAELVYLDIGTSEAASLDELGFLVGELHTAT